MVVLCKVVLTLILNSSTNSSSVSILIKAFQQCFPVVLFIVLQKVVLLLSLWMKS